MDPLIVLVVGFVVLGVFGYVCLVLVALSKRDGSSSAKAKADKKGLSVEIEHDTPGPGVEDLHSIAKPDKRDGKEQG